MDPRQDNDQVAKQGESLGGELKLEDKAQHLIGTELSHMMRG